MVKWLATYVHVDAQSGYLGLDGVWNAASGTTAIGHGDEDLGRLMGGFLGGGLWGVLLV